MMKILVMTVSSQVMYSKNQMAMIISVMISCLIISMIMFMVSTFHWFSLLLLLIYISGIMVLFMFIVSLTPNEKSLMKTQKPLNIIVMSSLMMMYFKNMSLVENLNTNSIFSWSMGVMTLITTLVVVMAYAPPKILMSFYKGMKSSK